MTQSLNASQDQMATAECPIRAKQVYTGQHDSLSCLPERKERKWLHSCTLRERKARQEKARKHEMHGQVRNRKKGAGARASCEAPASLLLRESFLVLTA
eukprot:630100-Pelagomonas_calceolata.AAC.1